MIKHNLDLGRWDCKWISNFLLPFLPQVSGYDYPGEAEERLACMPAAQNLILAMVAHFSNPLTFKEMMKLFRLKF